MVDRSTFPPQDHFHLQQRFEADIFDCEVEGCIPKELDGALFRVGSDWAYPPKFADDVPFNQDGYISRFRIKGGKCSYSGRWINTLRLQKNRAAGRQLFGYYRNPHTDDSSVQDLLHPEWRSVANTAPLAHGGKLFALKEDGLPYQIDPCTLQTLGQWDFQGQYQCPTFTAHPKIDPATGEMICYGYEASGMASNDLRVFSISAAGKLQREVRLNVPYVSMLHDIALTEKHIIFPVFPYVTSTDWLQLGKVHWAWDQSLPTWFGILPRDGEAEDVRWFNGPTSAVMHTANARTEGDKVILDAPIFDGNPFPFFPALDGSPWDPIKGRATIRRTTFDLSSKQDSYAQEILFPDLGVVDLIRIDDRFTSLPYRYAFTAFNDPSCPFDRDRAGDIRRPIANSYGRFDMRERRFESFFAGATHSLQEVEVVPRHRGAAEGDGFVIGVANNFAKLRSELVIVDAQNLPAGELARIILPFRSNVQVHGRWYDASSLPQLATEIL